MDTFFLALLLTLLAGLSTTIGSFVAFFIKTPKPRFISIIMGFSGGVMILVSFVELLQEGISSNGLVLALVFFFVGMLIMLLIDITVSHKYELENSTEKDCPKDCPELQIEFQEDPGQGQYCQEPRFKGQRKFRGRHKHRQMVVSQLEEVNVSIKQIEKAGILVFLGVFIHNLPEGMATFVGTLKDVELGILLAVAIAIHNIPEGIAVAIPIYTSTGSRSKAVFWSFMSGISEFLGVVIVGTLLLPFYNDFIIGALLAMVAGFMVYVSLDELLPVAHSTCASSNEHLSIIGIILGMVVMAISLTLL